MNPKSCRKTSASSFASGATSRSRRTISITIAALSSDCATYARAPSEKYHPVASARLLRRSTVPQISVANARAPATSSAAEAMRAASRSAPDAHGWATERRMTLVAISGISARTRLAEGSSIPENRGISRSDMPMTKSPANPRSWSCPCACTSACQRSPHDQSSVWASGSSTASKKPPNNASARLVIRNRRYGAS